MHRDRLPGRDRGATRVREDGHPALVADVERGRQDASAGGLDLPTERISVVGADVDGPGHGLLWRHRRTDARDILAVEHRPAVAAVLGSGSTWTSQPNSVE